MNAPKIQRWIDLLAALLVRRRPATFTDFARDVPAYLEDGSVATGKPSASVKRVFERDKLELRKQGVPIESIGNDGSEESAYQLRTKDFYLPYLGVASTRGIHHPDKIDRDGYRSLATLAFESDELQAIVDGAARVTQIGDPTLVADARSAIRKLAFDLPLGATDGSDEEVLVLPKRRADSHVLAMLGDGLFRRKRVTFRYHTIGTDQDAERVVEPYGLFFVSGHWYLVARDVEKDALRNFRVSRMADIRANSARALTSDYDIPTDFSLKEHAKSRQAWEIGDGDAYIAVVEFRGETGAVMAAAALGRPDDSAPARRRFDVRRTDTFARWLFAFGGEAMPVAPPSLVDAYAGVVNETRALYEASRVHV